MEINEMVLDAMRKSGEPLSAGKITEITKYRKNENYRNIPETITKT